MSRRRVVITGMGCVTPLGNEVETFWANVLAGKSGMAPITSFDAQTFATNFAAEVKNFDLGEYLEDRSDLAYAPVNCQFAVAAGLQAWKQSGLDNWSELDRNRVGVYLGAGEGPLDFDVLMNAIGGSYQEDQRKLDTSMWYRRASQGLHGLREQEQEPNAVGSHVACVLGAGGAVFNCLTACAASTQAIGQATEMVRYGEAEIMVAGGAHSMIHLFGITGFVRLTALSTRNDEPARASRPFDLERDGFVVGEGAGIVVLEELESARARGAKILAEVVGYGSSADAFRITDTHPEGRGAAICMEMAFADAGVKPEEIDYISAHGTGTQENDGTETLAVKTVFKEAAYKVPMSSIKSMTGHLIGAAGAVELISCVLAIRDGMIPPTMNLHNPDPECDLDYVPNKRRQKKVRLALSNSFGFGGQNDSLIVRAIE